MSGTVLSGDAVPVVMGKQFVALGDDSGFGVLDSGKIPDVDSPTVMTNRRVPLLIPLTPGNPPDARGIVPMHLAILAILLRRRHAQMLRIDTCWNAAYVINEKIIRQRAVRKLIGESVRLVHLARPKFPISGIILGSRPEPAFPRFVDLTPEPSGDVIRAPRAQHGMRVAMLLPAPVVFIAPASSVDRLAARLDTAGVSDD